MADRRRSRKTAPDVLRVGASYSGEELARAFTPPRRKTRTSTPPDTAIWRVSLERLLDDIGDVDEESGVHALIDPSSSEFPDRYALVEQDPLTELYWISTHASAQDALEYKETDDSEYEPQRIVDLHTMEDWPILRRYVLGSWT